MNGRAVLHTPLSLASDSHFSPDQECVNQIGSHAHRSYSAAGVPEQLRRDGIGPPPNSSAHLYGAPHPDTGYQTVAAFSDSGSGSIATSPSSNASSAAAYSYASFPTSVASAYSSNNYSLANSYLGFSMSTGRRLTDPSPSAGMLPPTRSPGLGNPVSPSMGVSGRDNYTTVTPGLHRPSHALSPRYSDISRYHSQPETPRSVLSTTTMPLTAYSTGYQTASYSHGSDMNPSPPFHPQEVFVTIISEGTPVVPNIDAKIEKGFFMSSDGVWTCYRRNYFAVNVSFGLNPWTPSARLYLDQGNGKPQEQIQAMAVSLGAAVDGTSGKIIELIQHTPKRDKGPQLPMKKELLAPNPPGKSHDHGGYGLSNFHQPQSAPGPQLPLQAESDSTQSYSPASHASSSSLHAFERIQFKSATANNGKRRAQQQYYHLIVDLWANIQNPRDTEARWVKVATKLSHPVVVRGRSPSHYQNDGPHNATTRGSGGSGFGGSGQNGLNSRGSVSYATGFSNGLSGGGSAGMGGSMYRGTTYSLDPSPAGSHSVSSASSLSGGPAEGLVGDQHMADDEDTKMMHAPQDYHYYPSPIYDSSLGSKAEGTLPLPERRPLKEEYAGPAPVYTGVQMGGGCGRFSGIDSSRGYYPDMHAHTGY
ncbi:hypothetical protein ACEQ8H_002886 [Pleosporales sp. CAS-2024a]